MLARRILASPFPLITSLQPPYFHAITHSFAQRRQPNSFSHNYLRTLLPLTANSFFTSPSCVPLIFFPAFSLKSRVSSHLPPLRVSFALFSPLRPFVFNNFQP